MPASLLELFDGRTEAIAGRLAATIPYAIIGAADEADAKATALASIPTTFNGIPRSGITISERVNATTWKAIASYEQPDSGGGSDTATLENTYTFEIGGGTQNVKQGLVATVKYPADAASIDGINFDGENVNGVDIVTTQYQWSETYWFSPAVVTTTYKQTLSAIVGTVNDATFRGFPAGEVLFLGASGTKQGNGWWQITFKFARERNSTGLSVGTITGIAKTGWQYMWVRYEDDVGGAGANKALIKKAKAVYVETVYLSWSFAGLGIGS